jgi:hypothetical protein
VDEGAAEVHSEALQNVAEEAGNNSCTGCRTWEGAWGDAFRRLLMMMLGHSCPQIGDP